MPNYTPLPDGMTYSDILRQQGRASNQQNLVDAGYGSWVGGGGNEGGDSGSPTFQVRYSPGNGMPEFNPRGLTPQQIAQIGQGNGFVAVGQGGINREDLKNPGMVWNDPNYGLVTARENWKNEHQKTELLDILGPMAVGGIAGMASGGLGVLGNIASRAPQVLVGMNSGGFNPSSLVGAGIGVLGGLAGIPSWATGAARAGYGLLSQSRNQPQQQRAVQQQQRPVVQQPQQQGIKRTINTPFLAQLQRRRG